MALVLSLLAVFLSLSLCEHSLVKGCVFHSLTHGDHDLRTPDGDEVQSGVEP